MGKGIIVDRTPVAVDKGGDQQDERAFGLMEIGDHAVDNLEGIARRDDDLRGGDQLRGFAAVEIVEDVLQRLLHAEAVVGFVIRHPLLDNQVF